MKRSRSPSIDAVTTESKASKLCQHRLSPTISKAMCDSCHDAPARYYLRTVDDVSCVNCDTPMEYPDQSYSCTLGGCNRAHWEATVIPSGDERLGNGQPVVLINMSGMGTCPQCGEGFTVALLYEGACIDHDDLDATISAIDHRADSKRARQPPEQKTQRQATRAVSRDEALAWQKTRPTFEDDERDDTEDDEGDDDEGDDGDDAEVDEGDDCW